MSFGMSPFGGFSLMGMIFPILFIGVFLIVFGTFIFAAVRGITQWKKNNDSPRLTVDAVVVAKRADVTHTRHRSGNDRMSHTHTSTHYYVTFEVQSGDRLEFYVPDNEYGMLVEGDRGTVTFQGTRYLGFERDRT